MKTLFDIVCEQINNCAEDTEYEFVIMDKALQRIVWRIGLEFYCPRVYVFRLDTGAQLKDDDLWTLKDVKLDVRWRYGLSFDAHERGEEYEKDKYDGKMTFEAGVFMENDYWIEETLLFIVKDIVHEFGGNTVLDN